MHDKYSSTIAILLFFALMAFFVPQANKMGLGMTGIFYVMVGAGALVGVGALLVHLIKRRLVKSQTSIGELSSFLAGGSLSPVVDADPPHRRSRVLIPVSATQLVQYQDDDPKASNYGDDDEWYEEWEDEDEELDDWQEDEDEEEEQVPYARGYRGTGHNDQQLLARGSVQTPAWESPHQKASHKQAASTSTLLDLAPRLQVDPDQFSSRRMLIVGIPGSGKVRRTTA